MYLSSLLIDVGDNPDRPRPGRLWLRNLYHVHQRLCMAFPSDPGNPMMLTFSNLSCRMTLAMTGSCRTRGALRFSFSHRPPIRRPGSDSRTVRSKARLGLRLSQCRLSSGSSPGGEIFRTPLHERTASSIPPRGQPDQRLRAREAGRTVKRRMNRESASLCQTTNFLIGSADGRTGGVLYLRQGFHHRSAWLCLLNKAPERKGRTSAFRPLTMGS